ncbi:MAG: hypothetical protein V6Z86_07780 [Hyphomicrobiales bacterium]
MDAKLLFACFAAERGFAVAVGSRELMDNAIHELPVGLYVAKDIHKKRP